jgi:tetratricopeptide (TPR) repeat protein
MNRGSIVLLLVLSAASVLAQSPDARAKEKFKSSQTDYDLGRFEPALKGFSEAYEIKPLSGFLFNIAQCHRQLGQYERARFFYRRYLDVSPTVPKNADQVELLLKQMDERLAEEEAKRVEATAAADAAKASRDRDAEQARLSVETTRILTVTPPPALEPESGSLVHKWWFWTGIGVVVVGAAATTTYFATAPHPRPTTLGEGR